MDLRCVLDSPRYLGLYKEEVEAAIAYDKEAVRRRGIHAITNFDLCEYIDLLGEFCYTRCVLLPQTLFRLTLPWSEEAGQDVRLLGA